MRYKAIIFDVDHTLLLDHALEKDMLTDVLRELQDRHEAHHGHRSPLIASIVDEVEPILKTVRAGPLAIIPGLSAQFTRIAETHPELDIQAEHLAHEFCVRCIRALPARWEALPGAREILAWVSQQGLANALLTNGWVKLQQAKAALLHYRGPLFVSEAVLAWKPSPEIFRHALQSLGVAAGDTLYVGDNPQGDVDGSHAVGMHAAWIDEGNAAFNGKTTPDISVRSLVELQALLSQAD